MSQDWAGEKWKAYKARRKVPTEASSSYVRRREPGEEISVNLKDRQSPEKSQNSRKLLDMLLNPLHLPYFLKEKYEGRQSAVSGPRPCSYAVDNQY